MQNNIINASGMKASNQYSVLKYVRSGNLSRADIARKTSLTRASITNIIDSLIKDGLVLETGYNKAETGKRSIQLSINPSAKYAIGIWISRNHYVVSLLNLQGTLLEHYQHETNSNTTKENILDQICSHISHFILMYKNILGIGISSPGPVDYKNGIILNPTNQNIWHYFNICQYFEDKFGLKCFLDKDINSIAILEKTVGIGCETTNFVQIMADSGVGSSIVINNELLRGLGNAGELGHVSIDAFNGQLCSCGNRGCVELYASIKHIIKNTNGKFKSWKEIIDSYNLGDPDALKIVKNESSYLGAVLISCLNIVNIDTIVLSSALSYKGNIIAQLLQKDIENRTIARNLRNIKIIPSELTDVESRAPANLVLDKFFNGEMEP